MKYSQNSLEDQINADIIKSTERAQIKIIPYNNNIEDKKKQTFIIKVNNYLNKSNNNIYRDNNNDDKQNCLICSDNLTKEEIFNNFFGCSNLFCNSCLLEYFKEKINRNKIKK